MISLILNYFISNNSKNFTNTPKYTFGMPLGTERISKDLFPLVNIHGKTLEHARSKAKSGKNVDVNSQIAAIAAEFVHDNPEVQEKFDLTNWYYDLGIGKKCIYAPGYDFSIKFYAKRKEDA
jgi:hypothetical protein